MGNTNSSSTNDLESKGKIVSAIETLPASELWEIIFRYLPLKTLVALSKVCRFFWKMRWSIIIVEGFSTQIDDQVLRYLLSKRPYELRISNCPKIANLGPPVLISCSTIHRLRIQGVKFTPAGVEHIARGFISLHGQIEEFSLRGCEINDEGAAIIAECIANSDSKQLSVVTLSDNRITSASLESLLKALKNITRLNLSGNPLHETGAMMLSKFLETNTSLRSLCIDQTGLGSVGFDHIAKSLEKNKTLLELHCGENGIDHRGMQSLSSTLVVNKTLLTLDLQCNTIESEGTAQLASALKRNRTLKTLNLWDNRIGCTGIKAVAAMLLENSTLANLILKFNGFGTAGVLALAAALRENRSLQRLDLSFCGVGDAGAEALSAALEVNTILLALDLEDCDVGDAGACKLGDALRRNRSLHHLCLQCNRIGDIGAGGLAAGLEKNSTLCDLDLRGSSKAAIGPSGAGKLADALRGNMSLRKLNLERNALNKEHATLFPHGLCDVRLVRQQLGSLVKSRRKNRMLRMISSFLS